MDSKSADFSGVRLSPKPSFFAAVSDGSGSSVCETICTYQVAGFKWRCLTHRPLATTIVLPAAVVVVKGVGGQWHCGHWSGGQRARHTVDQLSARDLPNVR